MINQLTYRKFYLQLFWYSIDRLKEQFVRSGQNVKISTAECRQQPSEIILPPVVWILAIYTDDNL